MKESDKNIDKVIKAAEEILAGKKVSVSLEPEILAAIKQLLQEKKIQADPNFKKSLDKNIKKALSDITKVRKSNHPLKEKVMKYFLTFLSGAFATALIAMVALNQFDVITLPFGEKAIQESEVVEETAMDDVSELLASEAGEVNEVSHKDFGDVPDISDAVAPGRDEETVSAVSAGMGGGGGEGIMMERMIMPPYPGGDLYPPEVTYSYSGQEDISIPGSMAIYKTNRTEISSSRLGSLLTNFGAAAGQFIKNGKVIMQNMSFFNSSEKRSYNVDFNSGIINFHTNRDYNPNVKRPTEEDVPEDSELISVANAFLKEHGIDPVTLNTPEIDKRWMVYHEREKARMEESGEKYPMYIPSEITVIYPRTIDGVPVVDVGGGKVGQVRINIDILDKQIMSGSVNLSLNMDKTEYPTQDFESITDILEKTGGTNAFRYGPVPLRIDTPDEDLKPVKINASYKEALLAYIEKHQWRDGENKIYYIPVVMFKGNIDNSAQEESYEQVTFVPVISSESFK